MNRKLIRPREAMRRERAKAMLLDEIQWTPLIRIAHRSRLNVSTLHRFLYGGKSIKLGTVNRILGVLSYLKGTRKARGVEKRSPLEISRKA